MDEITKELQNLLAKALGALGDEISKNGGDESKHEVYVKLGNETAELMKKYPELKINKKY